MRRALFFLILTLFASACNSSSAPASETGEVSSAPRATIAVPLSLHIVVEQGNPTSAASSTRQGAALVSIASAMDGIWAQADVIFDPVTIDTVEMPTSVLQGIQLGDTSEFFAQVNRTFSVDGGQTINGFFIQSSFGYNGLTPQGANLFFVVDDPSVDDARVASHELGHVLGLHHDMSDPGQLMFSGVEGTTLSELEQTVARYTAQGLFPPDG